MTGSAAALVPYIYWATVEHVQDGDTCTLDVDLGFFTHEVVSFRLLGCNARELHDPGGPEARDHLAALLPSGTRVRIASVKPDKFGGRYDAVVTLSDGSDLVRALVDGQWAASWDGTGVKPVPPWPRTVDTGPGRHHAEVARGTDSQVHNDHTMPIRMADIPEVNGE